MAAAKSGDSASPEELEIGQLLVKHLRATQNQVNKCLEIQAKMASEGRTPLPRLGEILVSHGFVDAETIDELVRSQRRKSMVCVSCGGRTPVAGANGGPAPRCPSCGGALRPQDEP